MYRFFHPGLVASENEAEHAMFDMNRSTCGYKLVPDAYLARIYGCTATSAMSDNVLDTELIFSRTLLNAPVIRKPRGIRRACYSCSGWQG